MSREQQSRSLSIVHTESSCGWGGQEIRILSESRGFIDRGHRVTIIAPPHAPIVPAALRIQIPVVGLPVENKRVSGLVAMRDWIIANRSAVDVINTHSSTDSWLTSIACATMKAAPPVIRTRHLSSTVVNRIGTRWLYLRGNAHIVTTGEAIRRQLARDNRIPLSRMTSIPTGIDLARFVPGDARLARSKLALPERRTLGIVATMRAWKGHTYLFDALASDIHAWREWQILVIGGGPDRALLEAHAGARGLLGGTGRPGAVRFIGHQDDVVPWLQALDMMVLPSYADEGVPQAIMQAMACAIPVVSTPIGGIPEAVDDGTTGLLVTPRSATALAEGLATLRDAAELRARFALASRARAEQDFGIEQMLDRMEKVFRGVKREA